VGALLQEGIDLAVILNALRPVAAAPLVPADAGLTQRFRAEHQVIRGNIERLRAAPTRSRTRPPRLPRWPGSALVRQAYLSLGDDTKL
jgi:hypothetical protein